MLIGVCGSGSGSGKTTMAEELLRALCGRAEAVRATPEAWGAIKFTRSPVYTSVTTDTEILLEEGKDTARMLKAGAWSAVWVQSPGGEELSEALSIALQNLGGGGPLRGVIVEGNSAVELLKPDIVIFMSGPVIKSGAERALRAADVVYRPEGVILPADAVKEGVVICAGIGACVRETMRLIDEWRTRE